MLSVNTNIVYVNKRQTWLPVPSQKHLLMAIEINVEKGEFAHDEQMLHFYNIFITIKRWPFFLAKLLFFSSDSLL